MVIIKIVRKIRRGYRVLRKIIRDCLHQDTQPVSIRFNLCKMLVLRLKNINRRRILTITTRMRVKAEVLRVLATHKLVKANALIKYNLSQSKKLAKI